MVFLTHGIHRCPGIQTLQLSNLQFGNYIKNKIENGIIEYRPFTTGGQLVINYGFIFIIILVYIQIEKILQIV